jgi:ABC-type nitrate/sulfonate/bicarbonate transport system permease component
VRTALIIVWIVLFFVEYASATPGREGLGWFIADARAVGKVEEEFAGLFFLGILAFGTDWLVAKFQRRLLNWTESLETLLFWGGS